MFCNLDKIRLISVKCIIGRLLDNKMKEKRLKIKY